MNNQNAEPMKGSEFREFFIDELKDIYWAENHLHEALGKLENAATSPKLAGAFRKHIKDTEWQIKSLEKVFGMLDEKPKEKKCDAMAGIIKEAESVISDTDRNTYTRDAGLILAAQKAEHYEIATYGTLRIFAGHMERPDIRKELEKILENEKETDVTLTKIAENYINEHAAEE